MSLSEETKKIQAFIKAHSQIASLQKKDVSDFYMRLIDCVVDHNHLYYVENKPLISDKEYDELFDYLKKIEEYFPQLISSNSPTQQLVGQVSDPANGTSGAGGFEKAKHKVKLASLENTYNAEDLQERDERIGRIVESRKSKVESQSGAKITYRVEPKFDGLSVELVYEKGIFVQAITRGDGQVGDDVTENVKTIKNIPKKLKDALNIHVRGEIMMPKSVWKELNKEREEAGEVPFANTRNAAAGSIKLLDSKEVAKRGLVCYVYDILYVEPRSFVRGRRGTDNEKRGVVSLEKLGLPVFDWVRTKQGIDEVLKLCEDDKVKKFLENQDIDFDGLVIKVEDEHLRELIGSTDHHPRRAVAYKFPAQVIATQVNSVDFQVGRTGIITPVANLEPVELSGVTIKRVSLHNFDFITSKDIHLHDRVWLQRSGEVIPYIVSTITDRRPKDAKKILPPRACPSCSKPVVHEDIHYYCENPHCPAQVKEKIIHFVSKHCMDIEGIGESTVDLLVQEGMIKDIADIYTLSDPKAQLQMMKFPGFAEKKVSEIARQVEESKKKPLWRLLNGLGIPGVGKKTAIDLVKAINEGLSLGMQGRVYPSTGSGGHTLEALTNILTNEEFLRGIYGVGEKIVEGIVSFMKHHKVLLKRLEAYGVNLDPAKYAEGMMDVEHAKGSFSITGTFPVSREKIVEEMQKNGYLFHDSPTKTTDFMLVGEDAGSKKAKAEAMGLRVYEGWDVVVKEFSFLKNVVGESVKTKVQNLF